MPLIYILASTCVWEAVLNSYGFLYSLYLEICYKLWKIDSQSAGGRVHCWIRKLSERSLIFLLIMKIYVSLTVLSSFSMRNRIRLNCVYFCLFSVSFSSTFRYLCHGLCIFQLFSVIDNRHFPVFFLLLKWSG